MTVKQIALGSVVVAVIFAVMAALLGALYPDDPDARLDGRFKVLCAYYDGQATPQLKCKDLNGDVMFDYDDVRDQVEVR